MVGKPAARRLRRPRRFLRRQFVVGGVEVAEGQRKRFGGFDCEFIAVNHSIPDGLAVAIRTAAGLVLHTGDFKMDQFPLDGRLTDLGSFARLAAEGVDLFMVDSTNAEVPGFITSERELSPAIETVFRTCPGRVIVSSFASHVHRIQQVAEALEVRVHLARQLVHEAACAQLVVGLLGILLLG